MRIVVKIRNKKTDVLITVAAVAALIFLALFAKLISRDIEKYRYDYRGESEHWTAEFSGYSTIEFYKENDMLKTKHDAQGTITITFKGDLSELAASTEISCKFRNTGIRATTDSGFERKVFSWSKNVIGPMNDSEKVEVVLDGKTEIIEMKSASSR